jgi:hypothetical protein
MESMPVAFSIITKLDKIDSGPSEISQKLFGLLTSMLAIELKLLDNFSLKFLLGLHF